jgi:hypothetical protein
LRGCIAQTALLQALGPEHNGLARIARLGAAAWASLPGPRHPRDDDAGGDAFLQRLSGEAAVVEMMFGTQDTPLNNDGL